MTTVSQKQQPTGFCATTPGWCTPQPSAQVFSHRQVDGYLGPKVFKAGLKTWVLHNGNFQCFRLLHVENLGPNI